MARTAPSRLQVLANFCAAAAESMGYTLMRTAHSTFVKETEDFSCQILSREGLTVASPTTMGATWYTGLDYSRVIGRFDYREGDICVVSDPILVSSRPMRPICICGARSFMRGN